MEEERNPLFTMSLFLLWWVGVYVRVPISPIYYSFCYEVIATKKILSLTVLEGSGDKYCTVHWKQVSIWHRDACEKHLKPFSCRINWIKLITGWNEHTEILHISCNEKSTLCGWWVCLVKRCLLQPLITMKTWATVLHYSHKHLAALLTWTMALLMCAVWTRTHAHKHSASVQQHSQDWVTVLGEGMQRFAAKATSAAPPCNRLLVLSILTFSFCSQTS